MPNFTLEKIDQDNFKKIDTMQQIKILNITELQKQKTELEKEVTRINNELTKINEILAEYAKLP